MEDSKISMSAKVKNEWGSEYELTVTKKIFPNLGNDFCDAFSRFINSFMKAQGYPCDKDKIFLVSITEEEEELLHDYLWNKIRAKEEKSDDKLSEIYELVKNFPVLPVDELKKEKVKNMYTAAEALANAILDYVGSFE